MRALFQWGGWKKYRCPVCGATLESFVPGGEDVAVLFEYDVKGAGRRELFECPVCQCNDRERLIHLFLDYRPNLLFPECRLLHVAPEKNLARKLKAVLGDHYLSVDLLSTAAMEIADITNLKFPDHAFDAVICNHVLEHINNDADAIGELFRILKPGGWGILQVPYSPRIETTWEDPSLVTAEARRERFGQSDHVRIYGKDYIQRLSNAGFQVTEFHWESDVRYFGTKTNRFGLFNGEPLFFVQRPG